MKNGFKFFLNKIQKKVLVRRTGQLPIVPVMLIGMERAGFFASSLVVAITSKPMNAKKQVAAPAKTPDTPNGAKLLQFFTSAYTSPTTITSKMVIMFTPTQKLLKRAEFLTPSDNNIVLSTAIKIENKSK